MHLVTDSCWEGLICDFLMMYLFSKTNWINHTFHLIELSLGNILYICGNSLIITKLILLAIDTVYIFDGKAIFLNILSAKVLNHVFLEFFWGFTKYLTLSIFRIWLRWILDFLDIFSFLRCCCFIINYLFLTFIRLRS